MSIRVEFFGIPRARVGVGQLHVCASDTATTLGHVIAEVSRQFPEFAHACTHDGQSLRDGYIANIDGMRFVKDDVNAVINSGQSVLIFSADAGG